MKSMGEILMMYFSFSLTTSTQEGPKGVQLCNNIGEALRLKRRKPQLSSEKARKKLLGAKEYKESPQKYRDREDS